MQLTQRYTSGKDTYYQEITIGRDANHILVKKNDEVLYDGIATHINDVDNVLTFKTPSGDEKRFVKYLTWCLA